MSKREHEKWQCIFNNGVIFCCFVIFYVTIIPSLLGNEGWVNNKSYFHKPSVLPSLWMCRKVEILPQVIIDHYSFAPQWPLCAIEPHRRPALTIIPISSKCCPIWASSAEFGPMCPIGVSSHTFITVLCAPWRRKQVAYIVPVSAIAITADIWNLIFLWT